MKFLTVSELKNKSPLVAQSNQLVESRYSLTVGEQRLMYAMISLIHPDDKDFKPYVFKIQDLAFALNIDIKNAYRETDKVTSRIMERVLHIPQPNGRLLKTHWVSDAIHDKGQVTLYFSKNLKPYLLQMKARFTSSELVLIAQFQSFYSVRIYHLLKQYQRIGYREVDLVELREILGIKADEYPRFNNFKTRVLNQAKKEFETKINRGTFKSDLTFDLETFRTGRKITRLKFTIKKQPYQEELPMNYHEVQPPQISKMLYFGITEKQAVKLYKEKGAEAIENALDLYAARLQSGQVKKQTGGYLKKLIEEGAGEISQHEKQVETEKEQKALEVKKRAEAKAKTEKQEAERSRQKREQLNAKFEALPDTEKTELMKEFEGTLKRATDRKNYKEKGFKSRIICGIFHNFLEGKSNI